MKLNKQNLSDIELGQPIVEAGIYFARLEWAQVSPTKDKTKSNLVIDFRLAEPEMETIEGKTFNNERYNFKLTHYISLSETEKYTEDMIDRKLKEIAVAIGKPDDEDLMVEDLQQPIFVKIEIEVKPASNGYDTSNRIRRVKPIKPEDEFNEPDMPQWKPAVVSE